MDPTADTYVVCWLGRDGNFYCLNRLNDNKQTFTKAEAEDTAKAFGYYFMHLDMALALAKKLKEHQDVRS